MWTKLKSLFKRDREEEEPGLEPPDEAPLEQVYDVLVVSDFHLGEAAKEYRRIDYLKQSAGLDREFCDFLEYYNQRCREGHRWRLIIAGDLFDFLAIPLTPEIDESGLGFAISDEERMYGLENQEPKALWKLKIILQRHPLFFTYLADFLGQGHRVDILVGNHDQELYWDGAQQLIRDNLVDIYFGDERHAGESAVTPESLLGNLKFHPWFIYEPGLLYVEHGHQYDDNCSVVHIMHPVQRDNPEMLEEPMSCLAIRGVSNQFRGFSNHDKEQWSAKDYLRAFIGTGLRYALRAAFFYLRLLVMIVQFHRNKGGRHLFWDNQIHIDRRNELARESSMAEELAERLDNLREVPSTHKLYRMIRVLKYDQVALSFGGLFSLIAIVVLSIPIWFKLLCIALTVAGVIALFRHILRSGNMDTRRKLRLSAFKIIDLLDVPLVIMGHSHVPTLQPHPDKIDAYYLNSGCWITHTAEGEESHCTFIEVTQRDHPHVYLKRWAAKHRSPEVMRYVNLARRKSRKRASAAV